MYLSFDSKTQNILRKIIGTRFNYSLVVPLYIVKSIVSKVQNKLYDYLISIDSLFQKEIIDEKKDIEEKVVVYGNYINASTIEGESININNGDVIQNTFDYEKAATAFSKIYEAIKQDKISEDDREELLEEAKRIENLIVENKKTSRIKSALIGLKDFCLDISASLTASIIQKIYFPQ